MAALAFLFEDVLAGRECRGVGGQRIFLVSGVWRQRPSTLAAAVLLLLSLSHADERDCEDVHEGRNCEDIDLSEHTE